MTRTLRVAMGLLGAALLWGCPDNSIEGSEPGECSDGIDNDGDGDLDCADDNCRGAPDCLSADDDDSAGDDDDSAGDDDDSGSGPDDDDDDDDATGDDDDDSSGPIVIPELPVDAAIYFGDLSFSAPEELESFCDDYDAVVGRVSFLGEELTDLSELACLRWVEGDIVVGATLIETLSLPSLSGVGGGLQVEGNESLESVSLPELVVVGADLHLLDHPLLSGLDLDALALVGGDLLFNYSAVTEVSLPLLGSVGGDLSVRYGDVLETLSLPQLETVGGVAWIAAAPVLHTVELPQLQSTGSELYFGMDAELQTVSLPLLADAGGVRISSNDSLTSVSFPNLAEVWQEGGDLRVSSNPLLVTVDAPVLNQLSDNLMIAANESLSSMDLAQLDFVGGSFYVIDNPAWPTSTIEALRDAVGVDDIGGGVTISGNGPG